MDESSKSLPTSHLLGSVPAVISEEKNASNYEVPEANLQIFPPNSRGERGRGYQTLGSPTEGFEQQPANGWKGVFNISSYIQFFDVDTDIVLNRLMSSFYPSGGDFSHKIDANPDLYGLIWISTTLVFVLAAFGNCATYLMQKHSDSSTSWSFDVSYMNVAAGSVYGYVIVVPLAFYFLLQYLGTKPSLVRFWCLWGYSLFVFVVSSVLYRGERSFIDGGCCIFLANGFGNLHQGLVLSMSSCSWPCAVSRSKTSVFPFFMKHFLLRQ
ncbi:hypothetical protein F2P56_028497 [Juglans regia]|uniref:Protein YIP n=2 Tax=Juglans regia TaxID=51240 RepID=A0A2I4HLU9_JUGRE|nr:protein YIPF2-like isoform X2 [Juglans regia]KAF5453603.1 hypothetical protein F2P56_028497 [Juglans regia]